MTRRIVTVAPPPKSAARIFEYVLCPECKTLVEVKGGVFERHYDYDRVCTQSGKYPPDYA